jgi:hypothetical protein
MARSRRVIIKRHGKAAEPARLVSVDKVNTYVVSATQRRLNDTRSYRCNSAFPGAADGVAGFCVPVASGQASQLLSWCE